MDLRRLRGSITVADMRQALVGLPDEAILALVSDYGDRSHTAQLLPIEVVKPVSEAWIAESGYSESGLRLRSSDEEIEEDEGGDPVVVVLGSENMLG